MISRKCRIGAVVASLAIGSALLVTIAGAQNPPTARPRTTTGDRSATTPADCQQMTGADREECERALSNSAQPTDPNTVNSTTRSVPSSAKPSEDKKPDPEQASKKARQDPDEDENDSSESQPQDEEEQPSPDTTSEADSDSDTDSDSQQTPPQS